MDYQVIGNSIHGAYETSNAILPRFSHRTSQDAQSPPWNLQSSDQLLELLFNELSACFHGGEFGIQAFCLSPSGASERALGQPPDLGGLGDKGPSVVEWGLYKRQLSGLCEWWT